MLPQITLQDFSGGLATSPDEATLKPNFSVYTMNADVTESNGIARRRGHRRLTASALAASTYVLATQTGSTTSVIVDGFFDGVGTTSADWRREPFTVPAPGADILSLTVAASTVLFPGSATVVISAGIHPNTTFAASAVTAINGSGSVAFNFASTHLGAGAHAFDIYATRADYAYTTFYFKADAASAQTALLYSVNEPYANPDITTSTTRMWFQVKGTVPFAVTGLKRFRKSIGTVSALDWWITRAHGKLATFGGSSASAYPYAPMSWLQAENASPASGTGLTQSLAAFPGGSAVEQTGSLYSRYTIPPSTDLVTGIYANASHPASAGSNGAAWTSVTTYGQALTWSSANANVYVAPPTRNASSLELKAVRTGGSSVSVTKSCALPSATTSIEAYLKYSTSAGDTEAKWGTRQRFEVRGSGNLTAQSVWLMADATSANWQVGLGGLGTSTTRVDTIPVAAVTPIWVRLDFGAPMYDARAHLYTAMVSLAYRTSTAMAWVQRGAYPWKVVIGTTGEKEYVTPQFLAAHAVGNAAASVETKAYFDGIFVNACLWEDFTDLSTNAWTGTVPTGASATISATVADTTPRVYVDAFQHGYLFVPASAYAVSDTQPISFATVNDTLFMGTVASAGNSMEMLTYDGTTFASVDATGAGFSMGIAKQRLFTQGQLADPLALYDSAVLTGVATDPSWSIASGAALTYPPSKSAGMMGMGLGIWQDRLFYFTESQTWGLTIVGDPTADWSFKIMSPTIGCRARDTVHTQPNGIMFLANDFSVRAYGSIPGLSDIDSVSDGFIEVSRDIRPTMRLINPSLASGSVGRFYDSKYWLACSLPIDSNGDIVLKAQLSDIESGTAGTWVPYNNAVLVYRMADPSRKQRGTWLCHRYLDRTGQPFGITCMDVGQADQYGLYAGTNTGHIVQLDSGNDDDRTAIKLRWDVPPIRPGGYGTLKHFKRLHVLADATAAQWLSIAPTTDEGLANPVLATIDSTTALKPVRAPMSCRGREVKMRLTSDGTAQPIVINGLIVDHGTPRAR